MAAKEENGQLYKNQVIKGMAISSHAGSLACVTDETKPRYRYRIIPGFSFVCSAG